LWGWFCQLKWSFTQIIGRFVNEKAKWSREKVNRSGVKSKSVPEKWIFSRHNQSSTKNITRAPLSMTVESSFGINAQYIPKELRKSVLQAL
jgi:hypothetical protein